MQIPPKVAAEPGENPGRLKPKVLPAMFVSRQLVGPKGTLNRRARGWESKGCNLLDSTAVGLKVAIS
jgi:hypothetical protein